MTPEIYAYLAGIIDADGTIGVKKNSYAMRVVKDCGAPTYSERICVKQVESEAIDLLYATFQGSRYLGKATAQKGRPLFVWQVTDKRAVVALEAILPYLRIKKRQAENCLALRKVKEQSKIAHNAFGRGHVGSTARPAEISAAMEQHYRDGKRLNAVST